MNSLPVPVMAKEAVHEFSACSVTATETAANLSMLPVSVSPAPPWLQAPLDLAWWSPAPQSHCLPLLHGPGPPLFLDSDLVPLHGPGPPSLPLFCLRSTTLLDFWVLFCVVRASGAALRGGDM